MSVLTPFVSPSVSQAEEGNIEYKVSTLAVVLCEDSVVLAPFRVSQPFHKNTMTMKKVIAGQTRHDKGVDVKRQIITTIRSHQYVGDVSECLSAVSHGLPWKSNTPVD